MTTEPLTNIDGLEIIYTNTSEKEQHHELCLGVLAQCYKHVPPELQQAIYEGIEYAAELGFPVDAQKLKSGKGIFSGGTS